MLNIISKDSINNMKVYFYYIKTLKYASGFFQNDDLISFTDDLSSLIHANYMFYNCNNLAQFNSKLNNLQEAESMFENCKKLYNIEVESFDSLTNAKNMFKNSRLSKFVCNLPSLKNGDGMFDGSYIETFIGDLSSLESGVNMFRSGKLSPLSVACIANSLPKVKSSKITIGMDVAKSSENLEETLNEFADEAGYDDWVDLKSCFARKGWNANFLYRGLDSIIETVNPLSEGNLVNLPFYAKLEEVEIIRESDKEKADYCTEDGEKYFNLDLCDDACDLTGYTRFGSLLEASGYFGIIPKQYLETE